MVEWLKENIWWEITRTVTWWLVALSKPVSSADVGVNDLYVCEDDTYVYFQRENINGKIYKVLK